MLTCLQGGTPLSARYQSRKYSTGFALLPTRSILLDLLAGAGELLTAIPIARVGDQQLCAQIAQACVPLRRLW